MTIAKLSFFVFLARSSFSSALIQLQTTAKIQGDYTKEQVHQFLATPSNWPKIVLSSWNVEGTTKSPLKRNDKVDEIFGLPPLLPLRVSWTCVYSDAKKGLLDIRSPDGLKGIASDCRMLFQINQETANTINVDLAMEYEPQNLLGMLAVPVLTIDNALALKVLLHNAMKQETLRKKPLQDFQTLMGTLYGVAGLAHFADCLLGDSQLLVAAGCSAFAELPVEGKALAFLWCTAGPAAFYCSRRAGLEDIGLIGYGVIEVACAAVAANIAVTPQVDPLLNALGVQAIVAASWLYSSEKTTKQHT
jgi:hypothetical protein